MRHRFIVGVVLSLLLITGAFLISYRVSERAISYIGPAPLGLKDGALTYVSIHSSGWTFLNLTCNGYGQLFVKDQFYNRIIFSGRVESRANVLVVIPHEGTYAIFTNGSMFCSGHSPGVYPTQKVQDVLLSLFGILSFVLALLLWRWRS